MNTVGQENNSACSTWLRAANSALISLDNCIQLLHILFHMIVKGVKNMNDITTLTVRLPKEDKETLMKYAEDHDLSASQIVRQLIRHYLFRCNILENY